MKCMDCAHLNLRGFPKHANVGYGKCKLEKLAGAFCSIVIERDCKAFEKAPMEAILKREAWWQAK